MDQEIMINQGKPLADKISYWSLIVLMFLLPIFFVPSLYVPFQFTKVILLYAGVVTSLVAWIIARLKDGKIQILHPVALFSIGLVVLVYFISSVASPIKSLSLIGYGFEISTFSFIAAMAIVLFLVIDLCADRKMIFYLYSAFVLSFVVVALYQLGRLLFGVGFLSFGIFATPTDNFVGSWVDLGIYFGATAMFSFMALELLEIPRWTRVLFIVALALSLFFLSVIGITAIWYALGGFSLIFFMYNFAFSKSRILQESPVTSKDGKRVVPVISLVVLVVSFIFIIAKGNIYSGIANDLHIDFFNRFNINSADVHPTWTGTYVIAKSSLKNDPFFGVGPNRFVNAWLSAKPVEVNSGISWATDFNYGIGLIPTFIITTGSLGFLTWIIFIVLFLYTGFKVLFTKHSDSFADYLSISSFIIALYFWLFSFFQVPSANIIFATFVFTAIFFASSVSSYKMIAPIKFDIVKDPRTSFISVIVLISVLLGVMFFGYSIGKKYIATLYLNRAIAASSVAGDINLAEDKIKKAILFSGDDLSYRAFSELSISKLNNIFSDRTTAQDILRTQFQTTYANAQGAADLATKIDPTNYLNWLALGHVYETIVPLNIEGAYDHALSAYDEARRLNPTSPIIPLIKARLEMAHKNNKQAKDNIIDSLKLKNNYTDAIYFLAQIQVSEGDLKSAIQSVEAATLITPNDPGVYFQLGFLRYNNKDYSGAESAFKQAIQLTPDYANAKYFLGLTYYKLGKKDESIKIFNELKSANPDNKEIDEFLSRLSVGKSPLPEPEVAPTKKTPPLKEKDSTSDVRSDTEGR